MTPYVLSLAAQEDLGAIRTYLATAPLHARNQVIASLDEGFRHALRFPRMGKYEQELSRRYQVHIRSFVVRPYRFFYLPEAEPLTIVAILHGAQDIPTLLSHRSLR